MIVHAAPLTARRVDELTRELARTRANLDRAVTRIDKLVIELAEARGMVVGHNRSHRHDDD
jgi:hypothetical protein